MVQPALNADITAEQGGSWHLGGFCPSAPFGAFGLTSPEGFGHKSGEPVGALLATVHWEGQEVPGLRISFKELEALPDEEQKGLYLLAWDGRDTKWGAAKDSFETSTCPTRIRNVAHLGL